MRFKTGIIFAAALCSLLYQIPERPEPVVTYASVKELKRWYAGYNEIYFNNALPKNPVIDYGETDPTKMATTQKIGPYFVIRFNPRYTGAYRTALETLLHEQCHVETWVDGEHVDHSDAWRACMDRLYRDGAFKPIIIDGWKGR